MSKYFIKYWPVLAFFVLFVFCLFFLNFDSNGRQTYVLNKLTSLQCHTVFITKTYHECCFAFNFAAFSFGTNPKRESPKGLNRNDQSINSLQSMLGWNDKMAEDEAKVNKLLNKLIFRVLKKTKLFNTL